ncbi:MAG: AAA family ATPase [Oscillospiraceae bacterium]|nr:AAA family ATPase [Oscillospiraceae bacterium]
MKRLIFINGTMGAGKTAVCQELEKELAPCAFLDGDWCWEMHPFQVTEETKRMVVENICFLLGQFLRCSAYETVLFCWVMQEQAIAQEILSHLDLREVQVERFTLMVSEQALRQRLERDVKAGLRQPDVVERSIRRLPLYERMETEKIDVSDQTAAQAARQILLRLARADREKGAAQANLAEKPR